MIVSYIVQIVAQSPVEGLGAAEELHWFGKLEDVNKDLKDKESELTKAMLLSVADPKELAFNRIRLQVTKHLLGHDINIVPLYPEIGSAQVQMRDQNAPIIFMVMFKVSRRPDGLVIEKEEKSPVKLIIPGM